MLLSVPGMNEQIKADFKISRRSILLLAQIVQNALSIGDSSAVNMLAYASDDAQKELASVTDLWLTKADLVDLNEKLKTLAGK